MKKLTLLLFLLFATTGMTSTGGSANDHMARLQSALAAFQQASLKGDIEKIISFSHPGLFTQMPKEQLIKRMKEAYAQGKAPITRRIQVEHISPIQPYSQGVYAFIASVREMEMKRPGDVTPDIDALMVNLIKQRMGQSVEISIDPQKNVMIIKKKSRLIAIDQKGVGWKFIEQDRLGFFIENQLLPPELVRRLQ